VALIAYKAQVVFVPLIIGAVVAYLLYPVAQFVARVTRLPHGLAALVVFVIALALLVPGVVLVAPLLGEQVAGLKTELTGLASYLETSRAETIVLLPGVELSLQEVTTELGGALRGLLRTAASESVNLIFDASKTFLLVIFTLFIAYYMTADAQKIIAWFKRLIPSRYRLDIDPLLTDINAIWAAFFRGQAVLALVVTAIMTALSFAIGLPQPLLMGLLAGLLEFLVSVGHTIWLIVALALALTQGSTLLPVSNVAFALIVVATNLVFTKFDLNVLIPAIVGSRVRLHPMVVLIGIIVGASVGGVLGIALAAPTIASLRVLGRYVYFWLFDQEPQPEPTPAPVEKRVPRRSRAAPARSKARETTLP
jgi:predicted PurR-regulated permease PerM